MRIRGVKRLKAQLAKLRGQLMPGPIVLLYHRITQLSQDPHLLVVTPEHFEAQLLILRRHYQIVSLAELVERLARGSRLGPLVALTFDDGYADNNTTALPLLKKHGVPATFYLASGFVGTAREYLQDDLERLLLLSDQCPNELQIKVASQQWTWSLRSQNLEEESPASDVPWSVIADTDPTPRHRAHREIHELLRGRTPREREGVLQQLRSQLPDPGPARLTHRAMSWEQARDMADCELVELGAHTVNHPWLSTLSLAEQRTEILDSKRVLEEQIGRSVASFAYPYGKGDSYTKETVALVKESGFTNTCSNFRKRIGGHTDPFQLPRLVVRDWDGDEFLRKVKAGQL